MSQLALKTPIVNAFGDRSFEAINGLTFAKQAAKDVLSPYYQSLLTEKEGLFLIVGTDSGLLYDFIKNNETHKNCTFIFIEFDDVLEAINLTPQADALWEQPIRIVTQDFNFGILSHEFNSEIIRKKIHLIKSVAVMDANADSPYHQLWRDFEVKFTGYCMSEYNALSSRVFQEQAVLNAADNIIPAIDVLKTLDGREVVILGGGPTLDDSIDWIRENQDRLIIFAAARISKRLEKEAIVADFFVTVDPFDWSFDNSKGVLSFAENSILAHSYHAQRKIVSQWNGLSIYTGPKYPWFVEGEVKNVDTLGPTVTNSALHLACTLGASRVFLCGVDFCFAKGKTHESGSIEAENADIFGHKGKAMLLDNAGQMTETGNDFYAAKASMETMIKFYVAQRNIEFISLGLHSAKMEHVSYQPCEAVELQNDAKLEVMTDIKLKLPLSVEQRLESVKQTLKILKQQQKRFEKMLTLSSEAKDVATKIYHPKTQLSNPKMVSKLKRLRKKLDVLIGRDGDMLANYQVSIFAESFKPLEDENAMSQEEVVEQLQAFYGAVKEVSQHFFDLLKQGVARAQLRLDELKRGSKPSDLVERWKSWYEYGRSVQWQTWHTNRLSAEEQAVLDTALKAFNDEYEKKDHHYLSMIKKNVGNVASLLARANHAFTNKNVTEIQGIIEHTESVASVNVLQKTNFIALLSGMKLELQGQAVDAFNVYVDIEVAPFKHIALKKMLDISMGLKDFDTALIVLERLCGISLEYMVPYADLLVLLNNKPFAVEVLKIYISKEPERMTVKNKLAQLLIELELATEARQVLSEVLAVDDNNSTALHLLSLVS